MNISRIYTRDVISVPQSTTLREAAETMRKHHVGCLVVTEDGTRHKHAIGIITDRDMVVQAMAMGADVHDTTVAEVMTPKVARVEESADLHRALEKMAALGIRRLAVTDEHDGITGVLSLDDVIDGFAHELGDAARVFRQERVREAAATGVPAEIEFAPQFSV